MPVSRDHSQVSAIVDAPIRLAPVIEQFVTAAIITGDMTLPFHYPQLQDIQNWQIGFRKHGVTGRNLVSTSPGEWQPGWYVIALNGFDDPFFIDINEEMQGFPVYYAPHGAGRWDAVAMAKDLEQFMHRLTMLRNCAEDVASALSYLENEADMTNPLWRETYRNRQIRRSAQAEPVNETPPSDPQDWQRGTLVLTEIGPQKLKVVQFLKQKLDLSPQEALALAGQQNVTVAEGYRIHLRTIQHRLAELGATTAFRSAE